MTTWSTGSSVETARRRAQEQGLDTQYDVGDAEALPDADGSFDVVASCFGVMFAPDHRAAAAELKRVTRPGGRIGLACWTLTVVSATSSG